LAKADLHVARSAVEKRPTLTALATQRVTNRPPVFFGSAKWRRFAAQILQQRGAVCQDKGHDPRSSTAKIEADHIVELQDGGQPFDPNNIMLRCSACHRRKTIKAKRDRETRQFWLERARR